jgi:hypothetical protein
LNTVPIIIDVGDQIFDLLANEYRHDTMKRLERAAFLVEMVCPVMRWAHSNKVVALVQQSLIDLENAEASGIFDRAEIMGMKEPLRKWLRDNDLYTVKGT